MDTPERSSRELDALFDQSPIAMVFGDRELRARRTNAAFRRLIGLPDEAIIGRRRSCATACSRASFPTPATTSPCCSPELPPSQPADPRNVFRAGAKIRVSGHQVY